MSSTPDLALPLLSSDKFNEKETVNAVFTRLDAFAQARLIDRDLATPPGLPTQGDAYVVAPGGTFTGGAVRVSVHLRAIEASAA